MKLWILRPVESLSDSESPWEPWYDKAFGFVVLAADEKEARRLADKEAGDENRDNDCNTIHPWLESKYSTCIELLVEGEPRVIIRDFASA